MVEISRDYLNFPTEVIYKVSWFIKAKMCEITSINPLPVFFDIISISSFMNYPSRRRCMARQLVIAL